jgi:hypothetical protein
MGSLIKGWLKWQLVPDAFRITHCGVRKVVLSCGVDRLKYIDPVPRAYAQPRTQAINARPLVLVGAQRNFLRLAQLKS